MDSGTGRLQMSDERTEQLLIEAGRSKVLARLRRMAAEFAGVVLNVLVRRGGEIAELDLAGEPARVSEFCRLVRGSDEGVQRCKTCRSLIAFGACYRGLTEYTCHGGVSVLAAPADGNASDLLVVSSCAFAHGDRRKGWRGVKEHVTGLPVETAALRSAYKRLPTVDDSRLPLISAIVEVAAAAIGEIEGLLAAGEARDAIDRDRASARFDAEAADREWAEVLALSRAPSSQPLDRRGRMTLADMVVAMVRRDPSMPLTVAKVARAARVTPNHFSSLFHQQTGMTFTEFLTARRIALAKDLLRDARLSIKEVAHRAGFSDPAYFARRFHKVTGTTPSQWRRTGGESQAPGGAK